MGPCVPHRGTPRRARASSIHTKSKLYTYGKNENQGLFASEAAISKGSDISVWGPASHAAAHHAARDNHRYTPRASSTRIGKMKTRNCLRQKQLSLKIMTYPFGTLRPTPRHTTPGERNIQTHREQAVHLRRPPMVDLAVGDRENTHTADS